MTLGILPLLIQQTTVIMIEIEYNGFGLASSCHHKVIMWIILFRRMGHDLCSRCHKKFQKGWATDHRGNTMGHVISDALKLLVKGWEVLSIQSYMRFESNHLTHMGWTLCAQRGLATGRSREENILNQLMVQGKTGFSVKSCFTCYRHVM